LPEFRYYCLRQDGTIAFGTHLDAADLSEAIQIAHDLCAVHPAGPFHRIEIWSGGRMLHPAETVGRHRKKIEIFSAGCSICNGMVELVKLIAGSAHDVEIRDMHQAETAERARQLDIQRLPSIVIDGELADCFTAHGPDEAALRQAISRAMPVRSDR
jgi:glutaredoxin 3